VRDRFETSNGLVEVVFDEEARIVSAHRFADNGRAAAAAIESWDHVDFTSVLTRQLDLPFDEAETITAHVAAVAGTRHAIRTFGPGAHRARETQSELETAGIALRFVAVLLDAVIVLFPLSIVVGLLSGGGYSERRGGSVNAGITVGGNAFWLLIMLGIAYYIVCESASGMTLGKRIVGIRVVDEDGRHPTFGAALARNLLRVVDGFLFYLVGGLIALASPLGQRLGDRVAHTVVVRR
jgi:uncharacterized RDD family membrane protein YckC